MSARRLTRAFVSVCGLVGVTATNDMLRSITRVIIAGRLPDPELTLYRVQLDIWIRTAPSSLVWQVLRA
jgi:hypothetical protein